MNRRLRNGAMGIAMVALLALGALGGRGVFAQEAASTPAADSATSSSDASATTDTTYDDFVAALAANLGISDPATVDTAIKATLTQMVADRLAAGEISANEAAALTERIAAGDAGFGLGVLHLGGDHHGGMGGPGGMPGLGGPGDPASGDGRFPRDGGKGEDDTQNETQDGTSATPAATT